MYNNKYFKYNKKYNLFKNLYGGYNVGDRTQDEEGNTYEIYKKEGENFFLIINGEQIEEIFSEKDIKTIFSKELAEEIAAEHLQEASSHILEVPFIPSALLPEPPLLLEPVQAPAVYSPPSSQPQSLPPPLSSHFLPPPPLSSHLPPPLPPPLSPPPPSSPPPLSSHFPPQPLPQLFPLLSPLPQLFSLLSPLSQLSPIPPASKLTEQLEQLEELKKKVESLNLAYKKKYMLYIENVSSDIKKINKKRLYPDEIKNNLINLYIKQANKKLEILQNKNKENQLESIKECRKINYKIYLYYKSFKLFTITKKELRELSQDKINEIEKEINLYFV